MSESMPFLQKARQGFSRILGSSAGSEAATPQGLPVNLGGYEFAKNSPAAAARWSVGKGVPPPSGVVAPQPTSGPSASRAASRSCWSSGNSRDSRRNRPSG